MLIITEYAPEVKLSPASTYLRNALEFWKMAKKVFNPSAEDHLWLNYSFTWRPIQGTTLKFQTDCILI